MYVRKNNFEFAGTAGKDAEERVLPSGTKVTTFTICNTTKGKDGKPDTNTWLNVKCFGYVADSAARIRKGMNVEACGKYCVDEYEKDGVKRSVSYMLANSIGIYQQDKNKDPEPARNEDIPFF